MAPRSGPRARSPRHGRAALGAAHRLPRRSRPRRGHRAPGPRRASAPARGIRRLLAYAVGNEIPASIVRWHGPRRIERFIARLADAAQDEDPGCLVTYVNYPVDRVPRSRRPRLRCASTSTSSRRSAWSAYLARLQNRAGDRPLLMGEIGFDSRRHGEDAPGAGARLAGADDLRRRLRGCLRLRLDRRVAPRRVTTSRTGTSASPAATGAPSPRWHACARRCADLPLPRRRTLALHLGGRV